MKHTQGKWTRIKNMIFSENDLYIGRMVSGKMIPLEEAVANAKRICLTHNSHDGLLQALKEGLEWIYPMTDTLVEEKERENVIKRVQQAIAQADE